MQATIVTANGAALRASESENADLFWAIRGGGSNFGVCTEFVLRLHLQRRTVFAGTTIFPAAVLDDLMKVISEWWETIKDHEGMLQILGRDSAGQVSEGNLVDDSTEQPTILFFRIASNLPCFITDLKKMGARTFRNFMTSVSPRNDVHVVINSRDQNPFSMALAKSLLNH